MNISKIVDAHQRKGRKQKTNENFRLKRLMVGVLIECIAINSLNRVYKFIQNRLYEIIGSKLVICKQHHQNESSQLTKTINQSLLDS